jgi:hypothetical protein
MDVASMEDHEQQCLYVLLEQLAGLLSDRTAVKMCEKVTNHPSPWTARWTRLLPTWGGGA